MEKSATVKIVLDPQCESPLRTLKLRLVFGRQCYLRAIDSKTRMTREEFEHATKKEVKSAIKKAEAAKQVAEMICEKLGEDFTIQEFGYLYKKEIFGKDARQNSVYTLTKVFEAYCAEHTLSQNTLINYTSAVHWVEKFRQNCLMSEITRGFILSLKVYMNQENNRRCGKDLSVSTVNMYFRGLKAICQYAIEKKIIRANPFNDLRLEGGDRPKTALTQNEWNAFLQYVPEKGTKEEFAHDMTILNFSLGGPNMADMLGLTNECIRGGQVTYIRQKSKDRGKPTKVTVSLLEQANRILRKYGHVDPALPRVYVLPYYAGAKNEKTKNQRRDSVLKKVNKGIRSICLKIGIAPFTTYNIRHTYALYARDLGKLEDGQIQQILGHKSIMTTRRYLNGITAPLLEAHTDFVKKMIGQ